MKTKHVVAVAGLLIFLVVGCEKPGPQTFPVTGTVTYQGKPLPLGAVLFVPREKHVPSASATIDANGHYQIEAVPGQYDVEVRMIARLRGQPAPDGEGASFNMPEVEWIIPENFSHAETSGLTVVVEPDKENQVIDLPMK